MSALQKQRHYILESRVVVYTNNRTVENILKQKELDSVRKERWQKTLADYDLEFIHIPGCKNFVADIFSRQNKKKKKEMNSLKLKTKVEIKNKTEQKKLMKIAHDKSVEGYYRGKKMNLRLAENFYWLNTLQNCKD